MKSDDNISACGDESRKNTILLKSAHIFNHDEILEGDILIEEGTIKKIHKNLSVQGDNIRIINCEGKYVTPGGIDINTRFLGKSNNITSYDDFFSGTVAALTGGTTTIINAIEIDDASESLISKLNEFREKGDSQVCCDYGVHVGIRSFNDRTVEEMNTLVKEHGINSFKIDLRDENCNLHDDRILYDMFKYCKRKGFILLINAINGRLFEKKASDIHGFSIHGPEGHRYSSSEELEVDSVHHIITLSNETNCPVIFTNIRSQRAAELIANSKSRNSIIFGEITAASLVVDEMQFPEKSWNHAAALITDPPISKDIYTAQKLIRYLADGGIDMVGSNHCRFTIKKKQNGLEDFRKIPSGITGVTERMSITWDKGVSDGVFDGCQFVAVTSTNAAQIFNLYPRKGTIKEGSDADIVIWDPKIVQKLNTDDNKNRNWINIFENVHCCGAPVVVLSNGKVVYDNKVLEVKPGSGRFLNMRPNSQYVYRRVSLKEKLLSHSMKPITRDPIDVNSVNIATDNSNNSVNLTETNIETGQKIIQRAVTRCGGRNMQESSFSLSGSQIDDNKPIRSSIRPQQPPGGVSSYPW